MSLYKGRYLIAVYDDNDNFIDCGTSIKELTFMKHRTIVEQLSRGSFFTKKKKHIYLIDCLEKHNDCFNEEDEIFLKEIGNKPTTKTARYELLAKRFGVGLRTIYRWEQLGKLNNKLKGEADVI